MCNGETGSTYPLEQALRAACSKHCSQDGRRWVASCYKCVHKKHPTIFHLIKSGPSSLGQNEWFVSCLNIVEIIRYTTDNWDLKTQAPKWYMSLYHTDEILSELLPLWMINVPTTKIFWALLLYPSYLITIFHHMIFITHEIQILIRPRVWWFLNDRLALSSKMDCSNIGVMQLFDTNIFFLTMSKIIL